MKMYRVHIVHTEEADVLVHASNKTEAKSLAEVYEKDMGRCDWGNDKDSYTAEEIPDVDEKFADITPWMT